jgi:cholesterol oxidase
MLGVAVNPRLSPADNHLRAIAAELGVASTFAPTPVGAFFAPGREGEEYADPYFGGSGPPRRSCTHCGACMVGCRVGAKNTLVKNYLHLAEQRGVEIRPDCDVRDVRPRNGHYEIVYRSARAPWRRTHVVRARSVVVAAGALGTMRLLFRCRDVTRSLPNISQRLGDGVRTNAETLLGSVSRTRAVDYSTGVAITSSIRPDAVTTIEPVRYPAGSSLMRFMSGPVIHEGGTLSRIARAVVDIVRRPGDFARTHLLPGWAQRTTILLVMRTTEERLRLRLGRGLLTLFRRGLVSQGDIAPTNGVGLEVARRFAARTNGIVAGSINEGLFGTPMTAHILGGCAFGGDATQGVISLDCEVHGHPGLFVVDGSIVPGNPGVNPSLTIAALAEYAATRIAPRVAAR